MTDTITDETYRVEFTAIEREALDVLVAFARWEGTEKFVVASEVVRRMLARSVVVGTDAAT